jgi:predicted solute-binding protein
MGLLDKMKKVGELAFEATKEITEKAVEVADTTKNAYKNGGTEAVGKMLGESTKKVIEQTKIYTNELSEEMKKTGNKASMVYGEKNKTSQEATRVALSAIAAIRKVAIDTVELTQEKIEELEKKKQNKPK